MTTEEAIEVLKCVEPVSRNCRTAIEMAVAALESEKTTKSVAEDADGQELEGFQERLIASINEGVKELRMLRKEIADMTNAIRRL